MEMNWEALSCHGAHRGCTNNVCFMIHIDLNRLEFQLTSLHCPDRVPILTLMKVSAGAATSMDRIWFAKLPDETESAAHTFSILGRIVLSFFLQACEYVFDATVTWSLRFFPLFSSLLPDNWSYTPLMPDTPWCFGAQTNRLPSPGSLPCTPSQPRWRRSAINTEQLSLVVSVTNSTRPRLRRVVF